MLKEKMPLVSIILQTFNRKKLLKKALQSAINQTYKNIEILIADNHSEDGTEEFCQKYAKKDARIKLHRHEENIGMVKNANYILNEVRGEFAIFLNDDDWLDLNYVEECINFMNDNPNYSIVSPSTKLFNGNSLKGELLSVPKLDDNNVLTRLKNYLAAQDTGKISSGCFKSSIFEEIKKADGTYLRDRYNEDIVIIMKFLAAGKGKVLKEVHYNKLDGGATVLIETTGEHIYPTEGINLNNIIKKRAEIFSQALLTDKSFSLFIQENNLKDISKSLYKYVKNLYRESPKTKICQLWELISRYPIYIEL